MDKLETFSKRLNVLKGADFKFAFENYVYRMGVLAEFDLTFTTARKAL